MKWATEYFVLLVLVLPLALGCGGGGGGDDDSGPSAPRVVVDWHGVLEDGHSISWALNPGLYRLQLTASNYGVGIKWIPQGAGCQNPGEVTVYDDECSLETSGQLVVTNGTTFGLGPSEIVTAKVTRL